MSVLNLEMCIIFRGSLLAIYAFAVLMRKKMSKAVKVFLLHCKYLKNPTRPQPKRQNKPIANNSKNDIPSMTIGEEATGDGRSGPSAYRTFVVMCLTV